MKDGRNYVILTDMDAPTKTSGEKPVMVYLKAVGNGAKHNFIASAYAREANKEQTYVDLVRGGKLIYMDENRIAVSKLEDATLLQFKPQAVRGDFDGIIAQTGAGAQGGAAKFAVGGIFTGTAADYANRSRQGGVDDGPSLLKIGSGEGSQVYGWGLYGSTVRGVAEEYAMSNGGKFGKTRWRKNGEEPKTQAEIIATDWLGPANGNPKKAIKLIKDRLETVKALGLDVKPYLEAIKDLRDHGDAYSTSGTHIYEQTFFTDRAPGDESHLLKWYEPVSEEQREWVVDGLKDLGGRKEVVDFINRERQQDLDRDGLTWEAVEGENRAPEYYPEDILKDYLEQYLDLHSTGGELYGQLSDALGSPKAASEFLARAGIDGVKYPVDSYGGKTLKDGDKAGWNYVSFRDDNIRVDHKWTDGVAKFAARPAMSALAKAKVGDSVEGVSEDGLRNEVERRIEAGLPEKEYRFKKPDDRKRLVADAVKFYKRFSQKTVMLSDGRCVYFVPDARAKNERGLSNEEAWAEYAIHAVTSSGERLEGKDYNERLYNRTKAANIWRIENILKAERCEAQDATEGRGAGIAFYGRGVDGKTIKIITRLDEADNIYADLSEITVVNERKRKELPPRRPPAEVVGAVRKGGDLLTGDRDSIANSADGAQGGKFAVGARKLDSSVFIAGRARVADDAGVGEQTPGALAASRELATQGATPISLMGQFRKMSLPMSEIEHLRRLATGDRLPVHVARRMPGGRAAAHTRAGQLFIAADVFGTVDKTDVGPAKDRRHLAAHWLRNRRIL